MFIFKKIQNRYKCKMSSETSKKIIKGKAKVLSHENCNVCPDTIGFLSNKDNFGVPVEFNEIKHSTDEGKKWIETDNLVDTDGNIKTPAIEKCDIYEDNTEDCKKITGFNKDDFANWKKQSQINEPPAETTTTEGSSSAQ